MANKIAIRRDTAANWTSNNPTLVAGEMGVESDTSKIKVGDGSTAWTSLAYAAFMPTGAIIPWASDGTAPSGFLKCDGSAVSRTTYAGLHAVLKDVGGADNYEWGNGDGSTTFNLPDLRGAFLRGTGSHGSETMADSNAFAGPSVGAYEDDQFQGHWHTLHEKGDSGALIRASDSRDLGAGAVDGFTQATADNTANLYAGDAYTDDYAGGAASPRTGDETRPFNAGVTWLIKT